MTCKLKPSYSEIINAVYSGWGLLSSQRPRVRSALVYFKYSEGKFSVSLTKTDGANGIKIDLDEAINYPIRKLRARYL